MKRCAWTTRLKLAALLVGISCAPLIICQARERDASAAARITVNARRAECAVDLDAASAGETDARGRLELEDVEPIDHYLHIRCPDQPAESVFFVAARAGRTEEIELPPTTAAADPTRSALEAAEAKIDLRRDVQQAVRLRAQGKLEEAVRLLHEAAKLDSGNSDLHRELGITFLLDKDWKRARVEMLEALRHDPNDADAHNGLGYALEKLGDLDGAIKEFRFATHLEPDNASYRQHYLEGLGKLNLKQAQKKK